LFLRSLYNRLMGVPDYKGQILKAAKSISSKMPHTYVDQNPRGDNIRIMKISSDGQLSRGAMSISFKGLNDKAGDEPRIDINIHSVAYDKNQKNVLTESFLNHFNADLKATGQDSLYVSLPLSPDMKAEQIEYMLQKLMLIAAGQTSNFENQYSDILTPETAFIFDLDGTLYPSVAPNAPVTLPEEIKTTIINLYHATGRAVAIATGRDLEFVDELFGFELPAITEHGAHLRLIAEQGGHEEVNPAHLDDLKEYFKEHFANMEGYQLEPKPHSFTLHIPADLVGEALEDFKNGITKNLLPLM